MDGYLFNDIGTRYCLDFLGIRETPAEDSLLHLRTLSSLVSSAHSLRKCNLSEQLRPTLEMSIEDYRRDLLIEVPEIPAKEDIIQSIERYLKANVNLAIERSEDFLGNLDLARTKLGLIGYGFIRAVSSTDLYGLFVKPFDLNFFTDLYKSKIECSSEELIEEFESIFGSPDDYFQYINELAHLEDDEEDEDDEESEGEEWKKLK
ncbi:MAG: hypothetical protein ACOCXG_03635 [Nanoarchaeota archaeon]